MPEHFDVVIAGGAVMGSSLAYHLASDPGFKGRVLVIEADPSYAKAASALSASSIRQQFSSAVNIRISLHGIRFLRQAHEILAVDGDQPALGLCEPGYLYLAAEAGAAALRRNHVVQQAEGADIALLTPEALAARFPYFNLDGIALGAWGRSGEGWFDGYALMQAFRSKARSLGVEYRRATAAGAEHDGRRASAVILSDGARIGCGALVNTAGASGARAFAAALGAAIPVYAKKRCVFTFVCREKLERFPLLIDAGGVWCRPEGQVFLAGVSPDDLDQSDAGDDFSVNWSEWEETVWPALASRAPAFESVKPGRAWAGHYDMNLFDQNALTGRLGGFDNVYIAAGFSGHGIQQSPAIGRGLAELIVDGAYRTLDLSDLDFSRLAAGRRVAEDNVI